MPDEKIKIIRSTLFNKAYKKLHKNERVETDAAITSIIDNPNIGEQKRGDLLTVYVYKFKFKVKEFLLAYQWDEASRTLLALGMHENFYRDLKK